MIDCFDIGGTYIRHGRLKPDGTIAEEARIKTPAGDWPAFVAAVASCLKGSEKAPVSVSLAGAYDRRTGLAKVANIPSLTGRRAEADLAAALERPVRITNDADCFALAEALQGAGRGKANVFAIILGSGVGGGLVIDGKLVTGHGGIAGEWGHGPVIDPTAGGTIEGIPPFPCGCGLTNCVDAAGSARGLKRIHATLFDEALSARDITDGWQDGERKTGRTVEIYATLLSRALAMAVNLTGADIVPVGGGLSNEAALIALIDEKTRELTLADYTDPLVVPGAHAGDGGLVGAGIAGRLAFGG
ncbi:ROK family protein [Roseibium aggregatum]|uniref:ROK family protein n=1 Tax=Roseibium aggregatum TaxID=187304 RepID=A0A926S3A1_9HYPH|nr:ROK family protein [Roseibium aggregatum]MBD1545108.1 ROK family protein [Roseibium aggregatum]